MDHARDIEALDRHYSAALAEHGEGAAASVQWSSRETQERRMAVLAQVVPAAELRTASILDFGCGTGHLLTYLRAEHGYEGTYTGYDIADAMVDAARAAFPDDPNASFERRNVLDDGLGGEFDLVLASGTFNNAVTDDRAFLEDHLRVLFAGTRRALAFNAMSTYVEFAADGLAYRSPEDVFGFCKRTLSPQVTLRHDYLVKDDVLPFEFTVYVHRSAHPPLPSLPGPT